MQGFLEMTGSVFSDPWMGFGGVGDYIISNANVASVQEAAHLSVMV